MRKSEESTETSTSQRACTRGRYTLQCGTYRSRDFDGRGREECEGKKKNAVDRVLLAARRPAASTLRGLRVHAQPRLPAAGRRPLNALLKLACEHTHASMTLARPFVMTRQ